LNPNVVDANNFQAVNALNSQDTNGNMVTTRNSGWPDTLGRLIPGSVVNQGDKTTYGGNGDSRLWPGVPTTDLSGCPSNTYSARIWNLPAFTNRSIK
jgi:hypothetical protein